MTNENVTLVDDKVQVAIPVRHAEAILASFVGREPHEPTLAAALAALRSATPAYHATFTHSRNL